MRSLLAGKSGGPSFFLVVDLAEALGLSVEFLAEATKAEEEQGGDGGGEESE